MPLDGEIQIFLFLYWMHAMDNYTYSVFIYFICYPKLDFMPNLKTSIPSSSFHFSDDYYAYYYEADQQPIRPRGPSISQRRTSGGPGYPPPPPPPPGWGGFPLPGQTTSQGHIPGGYFPREASNTGVYGTYGVLQQFQAPFAPQQSAQIIAPGEQVYYAHQPFAATGYASPSMQFLPTASGMAVAPYGIIAQQPSLTGRVMVSPQQYGTLQQTASQAALGLSRPSQQMAVIQAAPLQPYGVPGATMVSPQAALVYPQARASMIFVPT